MPDEIEINSLPTFTGLRFRHFKGESDFSKIANAIASSANGDLIENAITAEDVATSYDHLVNSDPKRNTLYRKLF